MALPRLAITIGDPAGIGPEIVRKIIEYKPLYKICKPIIIGDIRLFKGIKQNKLLFEFVDIPVSDIGQIKPGQISIASGKASYDYICKAVNLVENNKADAIVTSPISKAALNLAGFPFQGHTELLASLTNTKNYAMLMVAGKLRSVMVTRHIPVCETGKKLSIDKIVKTVILSNNFLQNKINKLKPRIGICALNPHAGEGGLLGKEEDKIILPAIDYLHKKDVNVVGPLPVDSAWLKAKKGEFDLLVTMYHDQTMIALKCIAPEKIVNVTIGLPFVRTSPGHGTGFDIAGKNIANPLPTIEAIKIAASFCKN